MENLNLFCFQLKSKPPDSVEVSDSEGGDSALLKELVQLCTEYQAREGTDGTGPLLMSHSLSITNGFCF